MAELYCPNCDRSYDPPVAVCPQDKTNLVKLADDPLVGLNLDGRFTIKARLGAGGMGAVYRAWQASVGREVAVKVIRGHATADKDAARRFLREARLASRLSQPNTVSVIDFGQTSDGLLYLAMELLAGRTLARVLHEEGPFPIERAVHVGLQLCDALEAAHAIEIVHRDLKPSNVMVLDEPRGRDLIKVLDFGLARSLTDEHSTLTASDALLGTPTHMAPEMALGQPVDERADLYALGVILYQMLAGRAPFDMKDLRQMIARQSFDRPPPLPPEVPAVLSSVVMRLLEKDPDARHRSAAMAREALVAARQTSSSRELSARAERPPEPTPSAREAATPLAKRPSPPPTQPARSRTLVPVLVIGALALLSGGGYYLATRSPAPPSPTPTAATGAPRTAPAAGPAAPTELAAPPPIVSGDRAGEPRPAVSPTTPGVAGSTRSAEPRAGGAMVELTLRSRPASDVSVAGRALGRTPQTTSVPRGEESLDVIFSRAGAAPIRKRIKPDRAQVVEARFRGQGAQESGEGFIVP